ncbi:MAG TPA: acyl-CoA carboxylase epsilon subunit [Actinomycetales bacterium]|nr:acyl-CoA carboxylase epsilon subunit [Actinomycetales bacterium]
MSTDETETPAEQSTPVALRVVHGNPSPEEVAALVAVLAARSSGADPSPRPRSLWATPHVRGSHHPGRGAWRASALPR